MKKRNGFVSNSSSSSFIIAYKGTLNSLDECFKLPENYPLQGELKIAECIASNINETFLTVEQYLDFCKSDYYDADEKTIDLLSKGFKVATGSFSSESGDALENFLCESTISYEDENFYIESEGGY